MHDYCRSTTDDGAGDGDHRSPRPRAGSSPHERDHLEETYRSAHRRRRAPRRGLRVRRRRRHRTVGRGRRHDRERRHRGRRQLADATGPATDGTTDGTDATATGRTTRRQRRPPTPPASCASGTTTSPAASTRTAPPTPATALALFITYDRLVHLDAGLRADPRASPSRGSTATTALTLTFHLRQGVTFHDGTAVRRRGRQGQHRAGPDRRGLGRSPADLALDRVRRGRRPGHRAAQPDRAERRRCSASSATGPGAMVSPAAFEKPDLDRRPVGAGMYTVARVPPRRPASSYHALRRLLGPRRPGRGRRSTSSLMADSTTPAQRAALRRARLGRARPGADPGRPSSTACTLELSARPCSTSRCT